MNELNIYNAFDYRKLLKIANTYFTGYYRWYNAKTVFAPQKANYTVTINKNNIRICYWNNDEDEKKIIQQFLLKVFNEKDIIVYYTGNCDVLDGINYINKIQIKRG